MEVFKKLAEALPLPAAGSGRAGAAAIKQLAQDMVTDAYAEIQRPDLTGNAFLADLASREGTAAQRGLYKKVAVHTVGGTSTKASRVHIYWMHRSLGFRSASSIGGSPSTRRSRCST
jgi:hypothetical protein